ncbi:MAG: PEP-CTERM sorting domain-containing protein [Acidobacteria bacterium]|nr:PEP-CTERM sorting domain-containing protein [Acidobacteriota bacterium]
MSFLRTSAKRTLSFLACLLVCVALIRPAFADSITYRQLRQDQQGRVGAVASTPKVARATDQQGQAQQQGQTSQGQAGTAQESSTHPEFVRLPDGRIVRYGPGIICDENCVEPIAPAAFRGPGPALWWIVPPIVAGGVLCAVLCRPSDESNPQPSPTIIIPQPTVQPTATVPPASPTPPATPPPTEIPEPGTIVLLSAGLGALLARKRMAARKKDL